MAGSTRHIEVLVPTTASETGAVDLTGVGSSTTDGTHDAYASAALLGNGTLSTNGTDTRFGAAALTGVGSFTTAGELTTFGAAALTGTGSSTTAGLVGHIAAADLTGTGTLAVAAARIRTRRGGRLIHHIPIEPVRPKIQFGAADLIAFGWLKGAGRTRPDHARAHLTAHGQLIASGGKPLTDKERIEELEVLLMVL